MWSTVVSVFCLVCVTVAILVIIIRDARTRHGPVYEKREGLFTQGERRFLARLDEAVGDRFRIMGKVRIADLISPRPDLAERNWKRAFYQISSKHVDFVLCDKRTLSPVCAVELDDPTHREPSRRERDTFVDGVFQSAALPLVRFPVRTTYSVAEIASTILGSVSRANDGSFRAGTPEISDPSQ